MDRHHLRGVAGEEFDGDARADCRRGRGGAAQFEQGHLAGGDQRIVVRREVADAVAIELQMPVRDLAGVGKVVRVFEGRRHRAVGVQGGVPAAVVEVQMGVDDDVDFGGIDAGPAA